MNQSESGQENPGNQGEEARTFLVRNPPNLVQSLVTNGINRQCPQQPPEFRTPQLTTSVNLNHYLVTVQVNYPRIDD
ncbi:hypothetical protein TWF679_007287 [Orbilia oligospora]|uniref:Uncharacterized protein n=1 Tax=Orbilia oligospora TaxID=2813651 RepID=A0A8H8V824_ORBOL|nr:hypothetical protein TWF679_007287 [Orbilia oligospora]